MSDLEIEKAAMGPRRWIELCGAYEKQQQNDPAAILCPRTTRIIDDLFAFDHEVRYSTTVFFIVPGGRYLVKSSPKDISVLDLGYSSSANCKLISSVVPEGRSDTCIVQPTPDGMGMVIYSSNENTCSVYEIYPQSETPRLTQIAHLNFDKPMMAYLLPDTVIWRCDSMDRILLRVWDYRLNHSISFSVFHNHDFGHVFQPEVIVKKTAVIVLSDEGILIVAIPPLSPQPPDFIDDNLTHMPPPLFTIKFPDGIDTHSDFSQWNTVSPWYFSSSHHLYFDMLSSDLSKRHRFQIKLNPDLSTASLHAINCPGPIHLDVNTFFEGYRICEDTLVSFWIYNVDEARREVYTESTSACFGNVISQSRPATKMLLPDIGGLEYVLYPCPASGRFVRLDTSDSVAVLDFF